MRQVAKLFFLFNCYLKSHKIHIVYGIPRENLRRISFELLLIAGMVSFQGVMNADPSRHARHDHDGDRQENPAFDQDADEIHQHKAAVRDDEDAFRSRKRLHLNALQIYLSELARRSKAVPLPAGSIGVRNWNQLVTAVTQAKPGDATVNIVLTGNLVAPAGQKAELAATFDGTLTGNGFTIQGLNYPLFNTISLTGKVVGLNVQSSINITDQLNQGVGAIARVNEGSITNCSITGSVAGGNSSYVGAVAGWNLGTIDSCQVSASVSGDSQLGGVVGAATDSGVISNSSDSGTVTATGYFVGGVVGYLANTAKVTTSTASGGAVRGTYYVGGAIGYMVSGATASNSQSTKAVSAMQDAGGFIGGIGDLAATVSHSSASGNVTATDQSAGGFIGKLIDGTITTSNATGNITGPANFAGGFAGYMTGSAVIQDSFTSSTVTAPATFRSGGFVGTVESPTATISRCYAAGVFNAAGTQIGDFAGFNLGAMDNVGSAISGNALVGLALNAPTNTFDLSGQTPALVASAYATVISTWDPTLWNLSNTSVLPTLR